MKVVLEIELEGGNKVVTTADELKDIIKEIRKELGSKEMGGDSQKRLNTELGKALAAQKQFKEETKRATNEAIAQGKAGEGAYRRMSAELSVLRDRLKDIQASGGVVSKEDLSRVRQLDKELKKIDANFGQFTRNVGNYGGAVRQGLRGAAGAIGGGILMGGAAGVGVAAARGLMSIYSDATKVVMGFDQAMADLNAVANVSDVELGQLRDKAKEVGSTTAFTATQVAGLQLELSKLGFTTDEILELTESVVLLSIGLGAGAAESAELLGATLNGFGAEASEAAKYAEVLAAAANKSALSFADFEIALPKVAKAAKEVGLTIEDTAAMLGILRDNGIRAETAGVGLRNIFLQSAKAGKPWEDQIASIASSTDRLKTATELFGSENAIVALTIASSTEAFEELRGSITGTDGELQELNRKKLDTVQGQVTLLRSAWEGFILSIEDGTGALSRFAKSALGFFSDVLNAISQQNKYGSILGKEFEEIEASVSRQSAAQTKRYQEMVKNGEKSENEIVQIITDRIKKKKQALKENETLDARARATADLNITALERQLAAFLKIEDETGGGKGSGGGGKEKNGVFGSIDYYEDILKGFEEQLPLLDQQSKEWEKLVIEVDKYRQIVNQLKAAEKARFDALEAARTKQISDAIGKPTYSIGTGELDGNVDFTSSPTFNKIQEDNAKKLAEDKKFLDDLAQQSQEFRDQEEQRQIQSDARKLELKKEFEQQVLQAAFDVTQMFLDAQFAQEMANIEKIKNAKLDALDVETKAKIKAADGNETEISKIEYEASKEREKIELEARKKQWQMDIKAAIINGALAIGQAFASLPPPASFLAAAVAAAATAAQVATIRANGYAEGGLISGQRVGDSDGTPIYRSNGDNRLATVKTGEVVLNESQQAALGGASTFRAIGVPGFASGGRVPGFIEGGRVPGFLEAASQSSDISGIIREAVMLGAMEGTRMGAEMGSRQASRQNNIENNRLIRLRQNIGV